MDESLEGKSWTVYSNFTNGRNKDVISDIFIFDRKTQKLVLNVVGVHFQKIMKKSLANVLSQSNMMGDPSPAISEQDGQPQFSLYVVKPAAVGNAQISGKKITTLLDQAGAAEDNSQLDRVTIPATGFSDSKESHATSQGPSKTHNVKIELLNLLFEITEILIEETNDVSSFDDVGIDSLMVIEVLSEIRKYFHLEIPMSDFQTLTTIKLLYDYLWFKGSNGNAPLAAELAKAEVSSEDASDSNTGNPQSSSGLKCFGRRITRKEMTLIFRTGTPLAVHVYVRTFMLATNNSMPEPMKRG
ncbi:hypothetical protein MMC22_000531 [Lobaria immixta]|nr:hypothetical protein [Lobaria immixta]